MKKNGWGGRISNLRMPAPKAGALPLGDAPKDFLVLCNFYQEST